MYYWLIKAWEIMYMKRYVFFTSNEIKISNQKHLSFSFICQNVIGYGWGLLPLLLLIAVQPLIAQADG